MNRTLPTHRSARGFTLLEILIATVAFAIVLAAINGVFYGALRLRNKSTESMERSLPLQRTVNTLKRDLANLVLPGGRLSGSLQTTTITNTIAGQVSPEFYTSCAVIDEYTRWPDVQKVSYALMAPEDRNATGLDLVRAVTRNLLPPDGVVQPPTHDWLMSGVNAMVFTYFDGTQWRSYWDSTVADPTTGQTNTLPLAIKVQIELASEGGDPTLARLAPVEVIVPMSVQPVPLDQTSGGTQ